MERAQFCDRRLAVLAPAKAVAEASNRLAAAIVAGRSASRREQESSMARRQRPTRLPAPYLRRLTLDPDKVVAWEEYPFSLPLFAERTFELAFERPVTILVGENGVGKSTLLEGIAVLAGFDEAGGGKGYRPVDHSGAIEKNGGALAKAFRAQWLPKVTNGWFFRAESFFSVARYLDEAARGVGAPPDFLSHSHGEGFLRFFDERTRRQGLFIFDEPESALSPSRQIEFLKLLRRMEREYDCQVILATHSPMLMAYPGATLLRLTPYGLEPISAAQTDHFRLLKEFSIDPSGFIEMMLEG
jgi:predicted ATPase